jgi:glutathione synthase
MGLKVAVQMDPIEAIRITGDSTFALMLEAEARGHGLWVYLPETLSLEGNDLSASVRPVLALRDVQGEHARLGAPVRRDLRAFDVILMRQDPPFDLAYITATHLLERIHPRTLIVNDPAGVRNAPEKIRTMDYPHLMPPTLISRDRQVIGAFRERHGDLVMKPLFGNGGAGVFKIARDDENYGAFLDLFLGLSREPFMIQPFLPEVRAGDKRIILIEGKPCAALNRRPAPGEIRANLVRGGSGEYAELTPREHEICEAIGPMLKAAGLIFVGIDVIGGYLTEINVTSPTGLRGIKALGGPDLAVELWEAIEARRRENAG